MWTLTGVVEMIIGTWEDSVEAEIALVNVVVPWIRGLVVVGIKLDLIVSGRVARCNLIDPSGMKEGTASFVGRVCIDEEESTVTVGVMWLAGELLEVGQGGGVGTIRGQSYVAATEYA